MMAISTRAHGAIDYGVAATLAGLAATRLLPRPVRAVLGSAGACHAGYAMLTDYEAGVQPLITMPQHLALDALGGLALCGAALRMRAPGWSRGLLFAIGAAELAVVAASRSTPESGPGHGSGPIARLLGLEQSPSLTVGYPPLDSPKPVADDVFIVDSLLPGAVGHLLPVRMTVVRLQGGDLLLHSPTRFTPALKAELERLGCIRHLVAPNIAHWTFLKGWQSACPDAVTWAAPGLRRRRQVRRSGVRIDHDIGTTAPPAWGGSLEVTAVPGGLGFREIALFHHKSRTLLLTDLAQNLEQAKVPVPLRGLARLFGVTAPDGMPPPYLRALVKLRRDDAARAARRLLDLAPERVVLAHGRWYASDGAAALRRSLRWLLD